MDDFADIGDALGGAIMRNATGPLIGGGAAQVGILATKLIKSGKYAKYAGLAGALLGAAAGGALMATGRREAGLTAIATAVIVGLPRQIEDMFLGSLKGSEFGAYTTEQLGAYTTEQLGADGQIELLDSGSGGMGMVGEQVELMGDGVEIMNGSYA